MAEIRVLSIAELPLGAKKVVKVRETEILLIHNDGGLAAVQPTCPHAGAPLEEGAVCNGRLVCPWHLGTFALPTGELLEPPAMEALKIYPVRLDGEDILVDPEPLGTFNAPVKKTSESPVFLIVGAGAAGTMAAATLRQGGFSGKIVAVDPVGEEPVDRTQLSKDALGGTMPLNEIVLNVLPGLDVERVTASVTQFSAAKRQVHLSNGRVLDFGKALVATGGWPKRLDIPGAELAHTIRHSDDVRQILQAAQGRKHAVIIGTSFIGLEAASALVQKGLQVTVVGKEKLPFAKQFGEEISGALKTLHEKNGTKFRLGVETIGLDPEKVTIRDGQMEELIPAELVIMGVGISAELHFDHDLPVEENGGGIKANNSLLAAQAVWVAGDIASVNGARIEHWRVAQQHGRIAALAMLGREAAYEGVPFFWTYHFGKRFGYLGHAEQWDETVVKGDINKLEFMVFYIKDAQVKAVLNCGFETQMAALAEIMRGEPSVEDALRASA